MDRWETGVFLTITLHMLQSDLRVQLESIPEQTMFAWSDSPARCSVGATMLMGKLGSIIPRISTTLTKCPDSVESHKWLWEIYIAVPCSLPVVSNVGDSEGMDNWGTDRQVIPIHQSAFPEFPLPQKLHLDPVTHVLVFPTEL